jgi:hippurate hydrolase
MQIPHLINLLHSEMTAWRQDLHAHLELGFDEHRTSEFVVGKLAEFGCEVHRNIGKTGVVGVLRTGNGPSIGLRADMDALPIHEANDFPYRSQHDGRMHACGHDGHTTMLLGAARYLAETRDFAGTVNFIFSPPRKASAARRPCFKMAYSSASRVTASSGCTIGPTCRLESSLFARGR